MDSNRSELLKFALLLFCVLAGVVILYPYLNFQRLLAQGDHGRDLYCFKKTFEGAMPYRDYWWQYGPLMPYYYSAFFRVFGVSIQSVLFGKFIIVLMCGIFFFLAALRMMSLPLAFVSTLFFWIFRPDFFYTYNHIGGVLLIIFILYCRFLYHSKSRDGFVYLGLGAVVLLSLIRMNIGVACLISFLSSLALGDHIKKVPQWQKRTKFYILGFATTILIIACIYFYFVSALSLSAFKQCFPYFSSYRPDTALPLEALVYFGKIVWMNFTASWARKIFGVILAGSSASVFYLFLRNKLSDKQKEDILITLLSLVIFLVFNFHEFILSASVFRIAWFFPIGLLLLFFVIDIGSKKWPKAVYLLILMILVFINVRTAFSNHKATLSYKQPVNLFQQGKTRIYIDNNHFLQKERDPAYPSENQWIKTVNKTVNFLEEMKGGADGKPVLAIPYDSLYYFLSGRDSAVYPLAFFNFINISQQDEREMIKRLEGEKVDIVLLSSRVNSLEPSLGVFGREYCPVLAKYIEGNFEVIAEFGDWQNPPGFVEHHGVKVLKRRNRQKIGSFEQKRP